jgi:hypothetical protein
MGTELVPETLYSNELTRLCAREDYIDSFFYFTLRSLLFVIVVLSYERFYIHVGLLTFKYNFV